MSAPAVPVLATLPPYRAAVAGLRLSTRLAADPRGAIVVVPGTGQWWELAASARAAGAAAIVVADPLEAPAGALGALREQCGGIPVVVDRPRLRPDVAASASDARSGTPARGATAPRLVTVECAGLPAEFGAVVRDGVGWARLLARGPLRLRSAAATPHAGLGLLETVLEPGRGDPAGAEAARAAGDPVPVTLSASVLAGQDPGGLLRVLAVGEIRSAVTVDVPASLTRVETSTEAGTLTAPQRFESPARLALRRALEALAGREAPADLEELLHDSALADELAAEPRTEATSPWA